LLQITAQFEISLTQHGFVQSAVTTKKKDWTDILRLAVLIAVSFVQQRHEAIWPAAMDWEESNISLNGKDLQRSGNSFMLLMFTFCYVIDVCKVVSSSTFWQLGKFFRAWSWRPNLNWMQRRYEVTNVNERG